MPIEMTELHATFLAQSFEDEVPPLVGTVSADGDPQISPKGTLAVYDPETLCFWERSYRTSYAAIVDNPRILVYCRNHKRAKELPFRNGVLRFRGVARIATDAAVRARVWNLSPAAEQARDPSARASRS
ncbi:MAG TPA: pyridoxamine 5'-phosphate oxidase family protein [Stellaceae bacterium]|nr:pyridoxamine 5'-phosphate oxidase family protein [Stellaceae bacterium]